MNISVDLAKLDTPHVATTDVCVIGAGAAGIYITHQLARAGKDVVLIEAGPDRSIGADAAGFENLPEAEAYAGATIGRFFGMGGTTAHWGGLLAPFTSYDVREGDENAPIWRHIVEAVVESGPLVLSNLGYRHGGDFQTWALTANESAAQVLSTAGIRLIASLHLPFRRKNLVNLLKAVAPLSTRPRVFFGAVATTWEREPSAACCYRAQALRAVARNGNELRVTAKRYIICAGALESARILLELNAGEEGRALRTGSAPGRYLTDHLSLPIADVPAPALERAASLFAPRFTGPWMRSFRLLPSGSGQRCFAHFNFDNKSRGFELARTCLQAIQQRHVPRLRVKDVLGGTGDLIRLAEARALRSRLYIPRGTPAQLQLDIEQVPLRENGISLTDRHDVFGRRIPSIRWSVSQADIENIKSVSQHMFKVWPDRTSGLPDILPRGFDGVDRKLHDAYHPAGTTMMGERREAVVDRELKVWGTDNIYVASTGVLPSAGSANPTFSMLCLAHRLAENIG